MSRVLIIIGILALILGAFSYRNLTYDYGNDRFLERRGAGLGFSEKTYTTLSGHEISYLEGPANGPPLLLIHGQMVTKEDYAPVLPDLASHFHIFAPDCYGHGRSSKDPEKYGLIPLRDDLISFIDDLIGERTLVSGHSSGALIGAGIAAQAPDRVLGLVLEDGPFFSTEEGRAQATFSYQEFKIIGDYLSQDPDQTYTSYYLDRTYMQNFFNEDGRDNWDFLVKRPYKKRIQAFPERIPLVWYYPPELGLNDLVFMTRNLQDGTGPYDLRFGQAFYDFSWFDGFDQEEELKRISCPTYILHVAPPEMTAPSYYDKEGILLSAMDGQDARRVRSLIGGSVLKSDYKSSHDIHRDLPQDFVQVLLDFKEYARD